MVRSGGSSALSLNNRIISFCLVVAETLSISDNTWHSIDTKATIFHCFFDPRITWFMGKNLLPAFFVFNGTGILPQTGFSAVFIRGGGSCKKMAGSRQLH